MLSFSVFSLCESYTIFLLFAIFALLIATLLCSRPRGKEIQNTFMKNSGFIVFNIFTPGNEIQMLPWSGEQNLSSSFS